MIKYFLIILFLFTLAHCWVPNYRKVTNDHTLTDFKDSNKPFPVHKRVIKDTIKGYKKSNFTLFDHFGCRFAASDIYMNWRECGYNCDKYFPSSDTRCLIYDGCCVCSLSCGGCFVSMCD